MGAEEVQERCLIFASNLPLTWHCCTGDHIQSHSHDCHHHSQLHLFIRPWNYITKDKNTKGL